LEIKKTLASLKEEKRKKKFFALIPREARVSPKREIEGE
jgi:hypothetical protein